MWRYVGERTEDGCEVMVVHPEGGREPLDPRLDLRAHSHCGFNYGYAGSGPAQLALALLADALGDDERALRVYQTFKFKVVSRLKGDRFELTRDDILATVERIEAERGNHR